MREKKKQTINIVGFSRLWVGVKCFVGSTDGSLAIAPPAPGQSLSAPVLLLALNLPTKPANKRRNVILANDKRHK